MYIYTLNTNDTREVKNVYCCCIVIASTVCDFSFCCTRAILLGILSILSYSGDCRVGLIGLLFSRSRSYGGGGDGVGLSSVAYVGFTLSPGTGGGAWVGGGGRGDWVRGEGGSGADSLMTGSAVKKQ